MEKYNSRNEVPIKYQWDLSDICKDKSAFNEGIKESKKLIKKLPSFVGATKDAKKLKEFLDFDVALSSKLMNLEIYAITLSDSDLSVSENKELIGIANNLNSEYAVNTSFFEPELLSLDKDEFLSLIQNDELKEYQEYLKNIYRKKEHILKEDEEKIVSKLTKILGNFNTTNQTILNSCHDYGKVIVDGEEIELCPTNYRHLMQSLPREERKNVYLNFNKVIDQYASVNADMLNNYVKMENSLSNIYKFNSSWERKLFDLELSNKVFESLINVCKKRKDVLNKYYKLKEKVLGIDELMPWDSAVSLYKLDKEYSIEEAIDLVKSSLSILGDDYQKHLNEVFDKRCIDYCQYKGKCSGGYNISGLDLKNSKILLSFNGTLDCVSTIAHESGHHVNHQYLYESNNPVYRFHSSLVSEVASLTNECLFSNYLVNNGTKEEALAGLSNIIDVILANLFGAVSEGEMERRFYQYEQDGGTLTKEYLSDLSENITKEFYPRETKHEYQNLFWTRLSHYYMFYYLFSYAICISVASYIALEITNGNKDMLDKYQEYLKKGRDVKIMDIFASLGIELEDEMVYNKAIDYFESLLDSFDEVYEEVQNGN